MKFARREGHEVREAWLSKRADGMRARFFLQSNATRARTKQEHPVGRRNSRSMTRGLRRGVIEKAELAKRTEPNVTKRTEPNPM
jgi:hypothetical protein